MLASLAKAADQYSGLIADLIVVDGQGDVNKQISDVESLIAQDVDAILIIPNSGSALAPVLKKAVDAGIVVIPFNLPVDGDGWTAFVGTDACEKGARLAASLRDGLGGQGNYITLGGIPGNSYTAAFLKCAYKEFEGTQLHELVYRDTNWALDQAKIVTTDLLTAYPEIDGVLADGGPNLLGAYQAMLAAKRPLVPGTGDDLNGLLKLYDKVSAEQPGMSFSLLSEPTWQSKTALDWALALLSGIDVPKQFAIQMELITPDNYKDWVRPELPDTIQVDTDLTDKELLAISQ